MVLLWLPGLLNAAECLFWELWYCMYMRLHATACMSSLTGAVVLEGWLLVLAEWPREGGCFCLVFWCALFWAGMICMLVLTGRLH